MWKSRNLLIGAAAAACALTVAPATAQAAPAPHTSGHQITAAAQASPATHYGWIADGVYPNKPECEMIGLDYYEDGYAADYDCNPEGACPGGYVLWLYVPEADSATSPAIEHASTAAAVQPAC
jgi:hypothetical protein